MWPICWAIDALHLELHQILWGVRGVLLQGVAANHTFGGLTKGLQPHSHKSSMYSHGCTYVCLPTLTSSLNRDPHISIAVGSCIFGLHVGS